MKNGSQFRNRTAIERLMTRPTRKSLSAKRAAIDASVIKHSLQLRRVRSSVEHRRDLLDVDAFLGHTQIMVADHDGDGVVGAPDRGPDQIDNERQDRAP